MLKKNVDFYKVLVGERNEFVISKQLLCSGTSIGANIRETEHSESKADFIHKLSISLKEANETEYWLDLLKETNYLNNSDYLSIQFDIKRKIKTFNKYYLSLKTKIIDNSKLSIINF